MEIAEICVAVGFCKSKSEARRAIESGAIRINDKKVTDPRAHLLVDKEAKNARVFSQSCEASTSSSRECSSTAPGCFHWHS